MSSLKSYLDKQDVTYMGEPKIAVYTYGRFNPPTKGHGKLIETTVRLAETMNATHFVIPSQTSNTEKSPLPYEIKLAFMKVLYPDTNITENAPTDPWAIPDWLGEAGYTDVKWVVGSDQLSDLTRLVETAKTHFNSFELVDAGIPNPDTSDRIGMSAPNARRAALSEDIGKFRVATGWDGEVAEKLMEATKISMGVK